ncbi:hypothetical protein AB9F29_10345, partial [Falsihalocynthiibacter sp. S25ZX9]
SMGSTIRDGAIQHWDGKVPSLSNGKWLKRALGAALKRDRSSIVHVNGATMAGEASLPNGGVKDSGWGRSGHYAVEDFTEIRLTTVSSKPGHFPF